MSKSFRQFAKDALIDTAKAIYRDVGDEFAFAANDVRQEVVEKAWFGRAITPEAVDFYRWLGPQPGSGPEPGKDNDKGDALGRTAAEPIVVDVMPMEGKPSNIDERVATAEAYARHQEAGPLGTMEMDDAHSHEWREFSAWIDRGEQEPAPSGGGIALDIEELEIEEAEMEI